MHDSFMGQVNFRYEPVIKRTDGFSAQKLMKMPMKIILFYGKGYFNLMYIGPRDLNYYDSKKV